MNLSTTLCLALAVALCYLVTVDAGPVKDVDEASKHLKARQSGPVVSPAIPGGSDDDDDDDDGKLENNRCKANCEL